MRPPLLSSNATDKSHCPYSVQIALPHAAIIAVAPSLNAAAIAKRERNLLIFCCSEDEGLQPVRTPPRRQTTNKSCPKGAGRIIRVPDSQGQTGVLLKDAFRHTLMEREVLPSSIFILVVVAQFSPQGLPNSRFWLHSGARKCSPRATVKPESCAWRKNVKR